MKILIEDICVLILDLMVCIMPMVFLGVAVLVVTS